MLTTQAPKDNHHWRPMPKLSAPALRLMLALLLQLPFLYGATLASAQSGSCPVQVFYGDAGSDANSCTDMGANMCKTREYALAQGKMLCAEEVQIFSGGLLRDVYRAPAIIERQPLDWVLTVFYWLAPFLVGGLAGWLLGRTIRPSPQRRQREGDVQSE